MSLATHGYQSRAWVNSAARRRVHARFRARLIRLLGMAPEKPENPYAATTGEMLVWARRDFGRFDRKHAPAGAGRQTP